MHLADYYEIVTESPELNVLSGGGQPDCLIQLTFNKISFMESYALLVRLEAKQGKEAAVETFLKSALPLALEESFTVSWYALRMGPLAGQDARHLS